MAFPSIRPDGAVTPITTATTSWVVTMPGTVAPTDGLFVIVVPFDETAARSASAAGWTVRHTDTAFTTRRIQWITKDTVVGDEGAGTQTVTMDAACTGVAIAVAIPGAGDPANWVFGTPATSSGTTTPDPPSLTSGFGAVDTLWITVAAGWNDDVTFTGFPTDYDHYTDQVQTGNGANASSELAIAARQLNAATENPGTYILASSEQTIANTMAIEGVAVTVTPERAEVAAIARTPVASGPVTATPERATVAVAARTPSVISLAATIPPFPQSRLGLRLELAFGATGPPIAWTWTDVSERLRGYVSDLAIGLSRGRADYTAAAQPASAGCVLDNGDGALTPANPSSPWWPMVRRGLPLRVWVTGTTPALILPGGNGNHVSTPDHPDFGFAADFDIRIRCGPEVWSSGGSQHLISKRATGGQRSWDLLVTGPGTLTLQYSTDGTFGSSTNAAGLIAALRPVWIGVTYDADNGASGRTVTFWRYDTATPPADITTWTPIGSGTLPGAAAVHDGTAPIEIGAFNGGTALYRGLIYAAEIRDGINGTLVANPDFAAQTPGTASFADTTGKTWTLHGDAAISTERVRYVGEVADISVAWPSGDNQPGAVATTFDEIDTARPSESRVYVTAAGLGRRLGRSAQLLQSTLRRHITRTQRRASTGIRGYWPCEDGSGQPGTNAAAFGSALPGVAALGAAGWDTAADNSLVSSSPLPTLAAGDTATISGPVPAGPDDIWVIETAFRIPTGETSPVVTRLIGFTTNGTAREWRVSISATTIVFDVRDPGGASLVFSTVAIDPADHFGPWQHLWVSAEQVGGDIVWTWLLTSLDIGAVGGFSDSFTGTLGRITTIDTLVTGPPDGFSTGHIVVHDGIALASDWLDQALTAWVGESAAHRFWRLCNEEDIAVEVIGDPAANSGSVGTAGSNPLGDLGASQAMGYQLQRSLTDLLAECVECDLGVMAERVGAPGLVYRTRATIEDQEPQLALDAGAEQITSPLEPVLDDQRLVNAVTVTSTGGSSATAIDQDSIDDEGLYETEIEIAGVGGLGIQDAILATQDGLALAVAGQNLQQSSWRLALGTAEDLRYPTLTVDLASAPELIEDWLQTALGDRVTLTGLPAQHPASTVELILEHITETMTPTSWTLELTCSPGEVWLTGELVA